VGMVLVSSGHVVGHKRCSMNSNEQPFLLGCLNYLGYNGYCLHIHSQFIPSPRSDVREFSRCRVTNAPATALCRVTNAPATALCSNASCMPSFFLAMVPVKGNHLAMGLLSPFA